MDRISQHLWQPVYPADTGFAVFAHPLTGSAVTPYHLLRHDRDGNPLRSVAEYCFLLPDRALEDYFGTTAAHARLGSNNGPELQIVQSPTALARAIGTGFLVPISGTTPCYLLISARMYLAMVNVGSSDPLRAKYLDSWGYRLLKMLGEDGRVHDSAELRIQPEANAGYGSYHGPGKLVIVCSVHIDCGIHSKEAFWDISVTDTAGSPEVPVANGSYTSMYDIEWGLRHDKRTVLESAVLQTLDFVRSDDGALAIGDAIDGYNVIWDKRDAERKAAERAERKRIRAIERARLAKEREHMESRYAKSCTIPVSCGGYADVALPHDVLENIYAMHDRWYEHDADPFYDASFDMLDYTR